MPALLKCSWWPHERSAFLCPNAANRARYVSPLLRKILLEGFCLEPAHPDGGGLASLSDSFPELEGEGQEAAELIPEEEDIKNENDEINKK